MSWLEFFASVIGSLAWPLVLLFVFCVLWYYFPKLAPFVHQLKYGDMEITFRQEAKAVAAASAVLVAEELPQEQLPPTTDVKFAENESQPPSKDDQVVRPTVTASVSAPPSNGSNKAAFARGVPQSIGLPMRLQLTNLASDNPRAAILMAWKWIEEAALDVIKNSEGHIGYGEAHMLNIIVGLYPNLFTAPQVKVLNSLLDMKNKIESDTNLKVRRNDALNYVRAAWNLRRSLTGNSSHRAGTSLPN